MPFLKAFLWFRLGRILLYVLFFAVFAFCFFLCEVPLVAAVYPALICTALGIVYAIADFTKEKRRHDSLQRLLSNPDIEAVDLLPDKHIFDAQQLEIIRSLQNRLALERQFIEQQRSDMLDYYSLWAHQIKTPIASLSIAAGAEDSPLSRKVKTELGRISRYVEMVMAYMRLESKTTDYVFREYGLDEIIRKCIRRFAPDFISGKIAIHYTPTDVKLITDEKWFSFVLEQLVSNCLKYTRQGSVTIAAEGTRLTITDTGIGIDPRDLPRIFEKGYTGFTGRHSTASSGIGLYLTRRVCDNLGIGIAVKSDGSGTCVTLELEQKRYSNV